MLKTLCLSALVAFALVKPAASQSMFALGQLRPNYSVGQSMDEAKKCRALNFAFSYPDAKGANAPPFGISFATASSYWGFRMAALAEKLGTNLLVEENDQDVLIKRYLAKIRSKDAAVVEQVNSCGSLLQYYMTAR